MTKEETTEIIENLLSQSDIVWGRYGSDTIKELAERIANATNLHSQ